MVAVVVGTIAVAGLHLWSFIALNTAEKAFEASSGSQEIGSDSLYSPAQLQAAARAASELDWSSEELKSIARLFILPLDAWTDEDEAIAELIATRNRNVMESVVLGLNSEQPDSVDSGDKTSEERRHFSTVGANLPLLDAARPLGAEARWAIRTGKPKQATDLHAKLRQLAEGLESQTMITDILIGSHVERILDRCLLEVVASEAYQLADNSQIVSVTDLIPTTDVLGSLRQAVIKDTARRITTLKNAENDQKPSLLTTIIGTIVKPIAERRIMASILACEVDLIERLEIPFGADPAAATSPPQRPRWQIFRMLGEMGRSNTLNAIGRCQATTALRQLLEAAIVMRSSSWPENTYPEARPDLPSLTTPDPFSGELLEYRRLTDGRLHLGVAGGPKLLKALRRPGPRHWLDPVVLEPPTGER
ncbi:MAG: hypothetical protein K8R59_02795 [Thermoanaerobaculales bacterium]|nr:hypothetical protein [Thermoanaerobaculales bacterium]